MIRLAARAVVLVLLCATLAAAQTVITVDASTGVTLGTRSDISGSLFGLTAFEGFTSVVADEDYRARVAALRPGCIRFSAGSTWFAPPAYDPAWYDTPEAAAQFEQTLLFGARYPLGRFLPIVRTLGAEPMASLGGAPKYLAYQDTNRPEDFDKWAAYCAGIVGLWKRFDPGLRLVQVWNEPNADWWQDPRAKAEPDGAAGLHLRTATKVAAAVKARFPDVQVGGPVLCWPPAWPPDQQGQKPWYTWEQWTLPWLRGSRGSLDFFDFHVYDVSPEDFAVQTEMLSNEARLQQGRDLPIWVTESNYSLTPEELADPAAVFTKRVLPYERFLLRGVLPQADKLAGNLVHDLHAKAFTILPRGADDPDAMYWLLWVLRDLRGRRLLTSSSEAAVLTAATIEQDRVTLIAFNDSAEARPVTVRATLPGGWWTGPEVRAIGTDSSGHCGKLNLAVDCKRDGARAEGAVTLPAYATASVSFRLPGFIPPAREIVRREAFGDRTFVFLTVAPVRVKLPRVEAGATKVWLRVGLLGPQPTDALTATLNGVAVPLKACALQEVPLEPAALADSNDLEVKLAQPSPNPRLALAFAALVSETGPR